MYDSFNSWFLLFHDFLLHDLGLCILMRKNNFPKKADQPLWSRLLKRSLVSGSIASIVSTAMISHRSNIDAISALSGTNATSHWLWGEKAKHKHDYSLRFTLIGYGIHHLCSVFWAVIFERNLIAQGAVAFDDVAENLQQKAVVQKEVAPGPVQPSSIMAKAALISLGAYTVDYYLIPKRFTPGFERHLNRKSMFCVYASFAVGLAARHCFMQKLQNRHEILKKIHRRIA
jgi:hypothetical protein